MLLILRPNRWLLFCFKLQLILKQINYIVFAMCQVHISTHLIPTKEKPEWDRFYHDPCVTDVETSPQRGRVGSLRSPGSVWRSWGFSPTYWDWSQYSHPSHGTRITGELLVSRKRGYSSYCTNLHLFGPNRCWSNQELSSFSS